MAEDDAALASALRTTLEKQGYEVVLADDFSDVTNEALSCKPHLILLDLMLPQYDGVYWCAAIRQSSAVPILFLSAAAEPINMVMAMNLGADDFIPKPVDASVLLAKIHAHLRRAYEVDSRPTTLEVDGVVLDLGSGTVSFAGQKVELTRNELRILHMLMEKAGQTVSRQALMIRLWENDCYVEENTLTVNINRLRRKLSGVGLSDLIHTRPGEGYLILSKKP